MPSAMPNTATRSHSRPFTRWIVDSVTPPGAASRAKAARNHGSKPDGSGCRSATPSSPSRSSRWLDPWPPPVRSSRLIAVPRPTSSRTASSTALVVPVRPTSSTTPRSSARRSTLPASLSGTWSASAASCESVHRERRSRRSGNHCGRPRVGRRRISITSLGRHRVRRRGQAQVGERGTHAGAFEDVGSQHGVDRHTGLVQRDVRREQQRVDAGEHGDRRRWSRPARPARRARGRRRPSLLRRDRARRRAARRRWDRSPAPAR